LDKEKKKKTPTKTDKPASKDEKSSKEKTEVL